MLGVGGGEAAAVPAISQQMNARAAGIAGDYRESRCGRLLHDHAPWLKAAGQDKGRGFAEEIR